MPSKGRQTTPGLQMGQAKESEFYSTNSREIFSEEKQFPSYFHFKTCCVENELKHDIFGIGKIKQYTITVAQTRDDGGLEQLANDRDKWIQNILIKVVSSLFLLPFPPTLELYSLLLVQDYFHIQYNLVIFIIKTSFFFYINSLIQ